MAMAHSSRNPRRKRSLGPVSKPEPETYQKRDSMGRLVLRTMETVAKEKTAFLDWLNASGHTPEKMAAIMKGLVESPDPRVRMRALELESKIRGFHDDAPKSGDLTINIVVGLPKVRQPKVVEAKPEPTP